MPRYKRSMRQPKDSRADRPAALPHNARPGNSPFGGPDGWLYGIHPVLAALANPRRRVHRIVATTEMAPRAAEAAIRSGVPRPPVETMPREALRGMVPPDAVHQGVVALVAPLEPVPLADLLAGATAPVSLVVVLDQVADPRNVGAVMRSAAAFGADAMIVQDRRAPPLGAALAKAASGAVECLPLVRVVNIARTLSDLGEAGFQSIGLSCSALRTLEETPLAARLALVFGAEATGLRRLVAERCDDLVRIPIDPAVESLNIAAAAAIALHAASRRLSITGDGIFRHG
jgi:23S rRNA (guanosine2251-2'-O)-methyltransferase